MNLRREAIGRVCQIRAEQWRPVSGYEGLYEVSNLGRVRSLARNVEMRPGVFRSHPARVMRAACKSGYPKVQLFKDGEPRQFSVHVLVAAEFLDGSGEVVRHLDGNPNNPAAANLAYGSFVENEADKRRHGRTPEGVKHKRAVLTDEQVREIRLLAETDMSLAEIAARVGVKRGVVWWVKAGKTWRHVK